LAAGYSSPGQEKVKHNKADQTDGVSSLEVPKDIKESFEVGKENNAEMPNIWFPDGVFPGFRETAVDFYWVGNFVISLDRVKRCCRPVMKLQKTF
jgi:hypothetical protein